jgi:hypothetical protein
MNRSLPIFLPPIISVLLAALWLVARPPWPRLDPSGLFVHPTATPGQAEKPFIILIATHFAAESTTPTPVP